MRTKLLVAVAGISMLVLTAGCSETLDPSDQDFVTNAAVSPVELLGEDHVKLVALDAELGLGEGINNNGSPDNRVIVVQCEPVNGVTTFGTVETQSYSNDLASPSGQKKAAEMIPGCVVPTPR